MQRIRNGRNRNRVLDLIHRLLIAAEWKKVLLQCELEHSQSYIHSCGSCVKQRVHLMLCVIFNLCNTPCALRYLFSVNLTTY